MIEFYQQESFRKHFYDCLKGTFGRQTGETNLSLEAGSSDSIFVFASLDASLVSTALSHACGMYAALKRSSRHTLSVWLFLVCLHRRF